MSPHRIDKKSGKLAPKIKKNWKKAPTKLSNGASPRGESMVLNAAS